MANGRRALRPIPPDRLTVSYGASFFALRAKNEAPKMVSTLLPQAEKRYAEINELLGTLLSQMQTVLEHKLVGVYLYGSLVWGDFNQESSDIDLLVATSSDID